MPQLWVGTPGQDSIAIAGPLPWADIRAYGAKGDGVSDDSAAVQAAINAGSRLFAPAGVYNIYQEIDLNPGGAVVSVEIHGAGQGTTIFRLGADISSMFVATRADKEVGSGGFFNMSFDGQWASRTMGTFFTGYPFDFRFHNITVQDFRTSGIRIERGVGSGGYDRAIWISHCRLDENYRSVWFREANSNWIVGNHITGEFGVLLEDSVINKVQGNTFSTPSARYAANMRELTLNGNCQGTLIQNNLFDIWWSDSAPASFYNAVEVDSATATEVVHQTVLQNNYFWGADAGKTGAVLIRVQKGAGGDPRNTRIQGNHVETAGAAACFLNYSDVENLTVVDNDLGAVPPTTPIVFSGSNSGVVIRRNFGYTTENSGATSVADGGTINHGLAATPTRVRVTPTVAGEMASVTALAPTTFTVALKTHAGAAGTTQTVYWEAEV